MQISVIIPTHNRSDALDLTLKHLAKQEFAGVWEAIVVNNNGTDDTDVVVRNWQRRFPVDLLLIHEDKQGPAAARNAGARAAHGDYLVFIDNDILSPSDFLTIHLNALSANPRRWIVGRIRNAPELRNTAFGRYRDTLQDSFHDVLPKKGLSEYDGATGGNWAMRRDEFLEVGGFDEEYSIASCEDAELAFRARKKGIRTLYNPASCVLHNDWAIDLYAYLRRQELYSISSVLLWRKYGEDSFQLEVVKCNGPILWKEDSIKTVFKKMSKRALSSWPLYPMIKAGCGTVEKVVPDTVFARRAYEFATALAIFRGIRIGFDRYGAAPTEVINGN